MKTKLGLFLLIVLSSCSVQTYYQLYTTVPENGDIRSSSVTFEDENLAISYNLWAESGDFSFSIYNKSSEDIVIQLNKSFFIMNGYVNDYYKNRVYTKMMNTGMAVTTNNVIIPASSSGSSTSYTEIPELIVPPQTRRYFSEYTINSKLFTDCDLSKTPGRKNNKPITFTKENSPFVFYNLITYSGNGIEKRIENHFYVSEIINLPQNDFIRYEPVKDCNKNTGVMQKVYLKAAPEKFYIPYLNLNSATKK